MILNLYPWAKVNLFLKVLAKRKDGYHQLVSIIHPIALFDELSINKEWEGLTVHCRGVGISGLDQMPDEKDNLVFKAAGLFFNSINKKPSAEITLTKKIPIGAGLGGGTSDAVSVLKGLNGLFGNPLSETAIYDLCLQLGMDAPFFLLPRPALCRGRGEIIEKRYPGIEFWCILVNPGRVLLTEEVYKEFNLPLTKRGAEDIISRFPDGGNIIDFIHNDLEIPAVRLCPEIKNIMDIMNKAGVSRSFVCGSGATVCGLLPDRQRAKEVMGRLHPQRESGWWLKVVSSYAVTGER